MLVLAHSAEGMEHFKSLLAGDILFVTQREVAESAFLYGAIAVTLWRLYHRLAGFARELLFFSLLALTVTSSVQLTGVLVVFVLLIAPALVARMQRRFPPLLAAWGFGWALSLGGIVIAYRFDLPTGYTMVFLAALVTLGSILLLSHGGSEQP